MQSDESTLGLLTSCISSRTITRLSVIAEDYEASYLAFSIITNSTLPSLMKLDLQVGALHEMEIGTWYLRNQPSRTSEHWQQCYSSLTSVHLTVTKWYPYSDSRSTMHQGVTRSNFLDYCLKLQILTVHAYMCAFEDIDEEEEPNYEWSSAELAMS
jgi:hypothetical protein